MIIYLAGQGSGMHRAVNSHLYEHVLFSNYQYLKRNFRWLKRRRKKEKLNAGKS